MDVMARMLMELLEKDLMSLVVTAVAGLSSEDAVKAVVQVSLTMASMDRPDVMTDVSHPQLLIADRQQPTSQASIHKGRPCCGRQQK